MSSVVTTWVTLYSASLMYKKYNGKYITNDREEKKRDYLKEKKVSIKKVVQTRINWFNAKLHNLSRGTNSAEQTVKKDLEAYIGGKDTQNKWVN